MAERDPRLLTARKEHPSRAFYAYAFAAGFVGSVIGASITRLIQHFGGQ